MFVPLVFVYMIVKLFWDKGLQPRAIAFYAVQQEIAHKELVKQDKRTPSKIKTKRLNNLMALLIILILLIKKHCQHKHGTTLLITPSLLTTIYMI